MDYEVERWIQQSWIRDADGRRYTAEVKQDLFGRWVCVLTWGSCRSRRGNSKTHSVASRDEAISILEATHKRRCKRNYRVI